MDALGSSWFPVQTLMLQFSLILGSQAVTDSSFSCTVERTVMESVQLQMQLNSSQIPHIREIEWSFHRNEDKSFFIVTWIPNNSNPIHWYGIEEKFRRRLTLTEMAFLNICNLTVEMSGKYTANIKFNSGEVQKELFRLCVYESLPHPKILIHSSSYTSDWCNVSLECKTLEVTEHLTVAWESMDLPRELEQRENLGEITNSRNLSLNIPLGQIKGNLTCVVSNPVEEKNATLYLKSICPLPGGLQSSWILCGIFSIVLMVILGAGGCFYKKMNANRGVSIHQSVVPDSTAAPQAFFAEEYIDLQADCSESQDPTYSAVSFQSHPQRDVDKGNCCAQSPGHSLASMTTYDKIKTIPKHDYL